MAEVGGEENEMATKLYRFRIWSLGNQLIPTITAVGIPCISNDISVIKLDNVAEAFGLGKKKIRRGNGPVDVLLGIHHPKLHKIIENSCQRIGNQWLVPYPWIKDVTELTKPEPSREKTRGNRASTS